MAPSSDDHQGESGAKPVLVTPEYARHLNAIVEAEPALALQELADEAGMSRQTLWRVLHANNATVASTAKVVEVVKRHRPGADLPPPAVAIVDPDDYAWIVAGRRLKAGNPERFRSVLLEAQQLADAAEKDQEAMRRLRALSHPTETEGDDTP